MVKVNAFMAKAQFSLAKVAGGICTTVDESQGCIRLRSTFKLAMLRSLTCGANSVLQNDLETDITWLDTRLGEVAHIDASLPCRVDSWLALLDIAATREKSALTETAAKWAAGGDTAKAAAETPSHSGAPPATEAPPDPSSCAPGPASVATVKK